MKQNDFSDEELESFARAFASFDFPFYATTSDIEKISERLKRLHPIEYEEYIVKYPKNLTSEDLSANHAAGLPITAERVVRCVNCRWFQENVTPHDSERPHFCALNGFDMGDAYGFCAWGEQS